MKKRISTFLTACCILSLFPIATSAQTVSESRMNVLESDRMGHIVIFNFEQKILQDAWNKKCEEFKIKSKPSKGLDVYTTVLVPDIHFEPVDIYVSIVKVDKTKSSISLAVSKGTTNFITTEDTKIVENIKKFLTQFITYVEQYKLGLDIKAQEDLIKANQKAYDKLVEDGKKFQKQLDDNKIEQENKTKELQALNKSLEDLKLKQK